MKLAFATLALIALSSNAVRLHTDSKFNFGGLKDKIAGLDPNAAIAKAQDLKVQAEAAAA